MNGVDSNNHNVWKFQDQWLSKNEHLSFINLERQYGDIPWLPLSLPKLIPDNLEHFENFFNENSINGIRKSRSFDEPYADFKDKESSWNNPYWKTLEIYRSKRADEWLGTKTIDHKTVNIEKIFPNFYQQIFDLLPYKEIFFVRFWSNIREVGLHQDQDWNYNLPLSIRSFIVDNNTEPTFYLSSYQQNDNLYYINMPNDTNSFAFNNGRFYHGANYHNRSKILMVVSGILDIDKYSELLEKSFKLYNPSKIINVSNRYVVYNVITKSSGADTDTEKIRSLYRLLLSCPNEIVNVEYHKSYDNLRHELRVIFWNQEAYNRFSFNNGKKYQEIISLFDKSDLLQNSSFFRFTSNDNYRSEFPEINYPEPTILINWTLIEYFKEWFINNIMPLGKIVEYCGNGIIRNTDLSGCRFLKERTGNIIRENPNVKTPENFPNLIAYNFDHAIEYAIKDAPYIYNKFYNLCSSVEAYAEKFINSCEHSAVLIGHNSIGKEITLHTHRLSDEKKFTMTIIVRITFNDNPVEYKFYKPIDDNDPQLSQYYTNPFLLKKYAKNTEYKIVKSLSRSSVLIFPASHVPHSVTYSNDIYLYFVYDNVTFKLDSLDQIKNMSQNKFYDQIYFYDM